MRRAILFGGLGIVAVAGGILWLTAGPIGETAPSVRTATVGSGGDGGPGIGGEITEGGRIEVVARRSGAVSVIEVAAGDEVVAGQALVRFEQASEQAAVMSATAEGQMARAALARARSTRDALGETSVAADEQRLAELERRLAQAETSLATAEAGLEARIVRAPVDGTVREIATELDTLVVAGTPLLDLVNNALRLARFEVPRTLAAAFQPGLPVEVASETGRHAAEVLEVRQPTDGLAPTVTVEVAFDEPAADLSPGMAVALALPEGGGDWLAVPPAALIADDQGGWLFRITDDTAWMVRVEILPASATTTDRAWVRGPLESGDRIAITNVDQLTDGTGITLNEG